MQDEEDRKAPEIILRQTERITRIIQQLLGVVRKKGPERRPLDVVALIESILDLLDHEMRKQRIVVVKEWENGLPAVMGDPDQLQQVFLNLLLNAIQSMPGGGTIRLSVASGPASGEGLEEARRTVEISVEDSGTGMPKEVLRNIFNPFFTTKEKGTGLGLMVTQGIVQDHEGWIDVQSEPGKGSLFKVRLPVCEGR